MSYLFPSDTTCSNFLSPITDQIKVRIDRILEIECKDISLFVVKKSSNKAIKDLINNFLESHEELEFLFISEVEIEELRWIIQISYQIPSLNKIKVDIISDLSTIEIRSFIESLKIEFPSNWKLEIAWKRYYSNKIII